MATVTLGLESVVFEEEIQHADLDALPFDGKTIGYIRAAVIACRQAVDEQFGEPESYRVTIEADDDGFDVSLRLESGDE